MRNSKSISQKEAKIRELNLLRHSNSGLLTENILENRTDCFLKAEVLASNTRVARVISARFVEIRDLTQAVNHYVQSGLYKLPSFVKGLDSNGIAGRLIEIAGRTTYVYDTDFSSYDSSQARWCQNLEIGVLRACCDDSEITELWETVIGADLDMRLKGFQIYARYCRSSGEKSTSWGNTYLTYTFVQFASALALERGCVRSALARLKVAAIEGTDLSLLLSENVGCLVEGDDNTMASNIEITEYLEQAAGLLGFKATIERNEHSGNSFCKFYTSEDEAGAMCASREFSSQFYKHGWSSKYNLKLGSYREAIYVQSKLLALLANFPDLTGLQVYARACLATLQQKHVVIDVDKFIVKMARDIRGTLSDMNYGIDAEGRVFSKRGE